MSGSSSTLMARWHQEAKFHDSMVEDDTRFTTFRAFGLSAASINYARSLLGDLMGKVVVDLGCGNGDHTIPLIQAKPFLLLGSDISYRMARETYVRLSEAAKKVDCTASIQQMAAEELAYASNSIDLIFGISVLHHLEIPLAAQEIIRVLRDGGRAVFVEPLNKHPATNLYRKLTPHRHTDAESPLDYSIFGLLEKFREVRYREFYLLSLGSAIFAFHGTRRMFN